ncbi:MAG: ABC transporter permease [Deltaproteobacteria bacterium]|nr:ABC transporter permease [Deltaproteobacteria bacterium]
MWRYTLRRLLLLIPTLWFVLTSVFFLLHLIPGDPIDFLLGDQALAQDRLRLEEQLHLDQSLGVQYLYYLEGLVKGDWGKSLFNQRPVLPDLLERFAKTLKLTLAAMAVSLAIALPLGVLSARKKGKALDGAAMGLALLGISIPNFYLGPLLILLFSIHLAWLPVSGDESWASLILPALTLGTAMAALVSRMTRSALLQVMQEDFIRTARAKGVSSLRLWFKHALKPALLPVVTVVGLQFGVLLGGAVITEKIFDWPGLGSWLLQAISRRDYPVVQASVLWIALSFIVVNLVTDLSYAALDPRVKLERE